MARERADYRPIMADMLEYTGGARLMTKTEMQLYTGKGQHYVEKHYPVKWPAHVATLAMLDAQLRAG